MKVSRSSGPSGRDPFEFRELFGFRIVSLANRIAAAAARDVKEAAGISLMEWRVILQVAIDAGASPAQITVTAGVHKSQVSRAIDALAKRDLLRFEADPRHPKRMRLYLTDASRKIHDEHYDAFMKRELRLVHGLNEKEVELLSRMLKRLDENLRS